MSDDERLFKMKYDIWWMNNKTCVGEIRAWWAIELITNESNVICLNPEPSVENEYAKMQNKFCLDKKNIKDISKCAT